MRIIAIIPARFASTRFPGKLIALLGDKSVLQHVYERSCQVIQEVYIATDDKSIYSAVENFGGNVVMTSPAHKSGTDRCAEALSLIMMKSGKEYDGIINIQGDEPFILPQQINLVKKALEDPLTEIATLVKKIDTKEDIFDINKPKVVFDKNNFALYFTRSPVPFIRDVEKPNWPGNIAFYKHIGIYGYRVNVLKEITRLPPSTLEMAESLEQLRWLQNGYRIRVSVTEHESMGIDSPEDLEKARKILGGIG